MPGIWSFRFILFFILVLFTQPHMRYPFLIPLKLGKVFMAVALLLHLMDCMTNGKPIIKGTKFTKVVLMLVVLGLITHFFNPAQKSNAWSTEIDNIFKVGIVVLMLESQIVNIYRAIALMGTLMLGTIWWIKGGVRLALSGATLTGDRLMGVNVTMIENPNFFAYLMVFFMPMYYYFYRVFAKSPIRFFFLGLLGSAAFIALRTGSRTGFLALGLVALMMIPRLWKESKGLLLTGIAGSILLLSVAGASNIERFKGMQESFIGLITGERKAASQMDADELSADSRWTKSVATFKLIRKYPLLGVGTNPKPSVTGDFSRAKGKVHNEVLMAGRQMGFPGMILYILLLYIPIKSATEVYKRMKYVWPEVADLAWTIRIMLSVVILAGIFSPSAFHYPHMLTAVAMCSLANLVEAQFPGYTNA